MFRFDRYGSVISGKDFIESNHPELCCLANLAGKKFSDLIKDVAQNGGDGISLAVDGDTVGSILLVSTTIPYIVGWSKVARSE